MSRWGLFFLALTLLAGVFSLWQLAGPAMWVARALFLVFLILSAVKLAFGRSSPPET